GVAGRVRGAAEVGDEVVERGEPLPRQVALVVGHGQGVQARRGAAQDGDVAVEEGGGRGEVLGPLPGGGVAEAARQRSGGLQVGGETAADVVDRARVVGRARGGGAA